MRQNEWLNFQKKATHTSIFKSPDTIDGKVGVVNLMPVKTVASVFLRPTTRPVIDATLNKRPKYDWINLNNFHLWTKDVCNWLSEAIAIRTKTNSGALRILSDFSSFNSFFNRSYAFIPISMSSSLIF